LGERPLWRCRPFWWQSWRRHDRSRQFVETALEQDQLPLENLQPVARPDRHHHADNGGDRYGEQEKDQENDQ